MDQGELYYSLELLHRDIKPDYRGFKSVSLIKVLKIGSKVIQMEGNSPHLKVGHQLITLIQQQHENQVLGRQASGFVALQCFQFKPFNKSS